MGQTLWLLRISMEITIYEKILNMLAAISRRIDSLQPPKTNQYQSDEINELAAAMAKAQGAIGAIGKNAKSHRHRYADLHAYLEAIRKPLSDNELAITSRISPDDDGQEAVHTMIIHSSGQWMKSVIKIQPADPTNIQSYGTAITYIRRYAIVSLLNLVAEDDDGEKFTEKNSQKKPSYTTPAKILPSKVKELKEKIDKVPEVKNIILKHFKINKIEDLLDKDYISAKNIIDRALT